MTRVFLYLVSLSGDPPTEERLSAMRSEATGRGWEIVEEHVDAIKHATKDPRVGQALILLSVISGHAKTVLAWSAARLARSLPDLQRFLRELHRSGGRLVLLDDGIDTNDPVSLTRAVDAMVGLEDTRRYARVRDGMAKASKAGRPPGRPSCEFDLEDVRARLAEGMSLSAIAGEVGASRRTLRRALEAIDEVTSARPPSYLA
jgi:DNA invertase Pin-like site-specific DNA recombinase